MTGRKRHITIRRRRPRHPLVPAEKDLPPWEWGNAWNYPIVDEESRQAALNEFIRRDNIRRQEGRNLRRDPVYRLYKRHNNFFKEWIADQKERGLRNEWDELPERSTRDRSRTGNRARVSHQQSVSASGVSSDRTVSATGTGKVTLINTPDYQEASVTNMDEPPAKRIHLEEVEDEVDADVPSAVTYANGGVGGLKDILAYHSGTLPTN